MTDAALPALTASLPDEFESPARRALRRLVARKSAMAGLVVIADFHPAGGVCALDRAL